VKQPLENESPLSPQRAFVVQFRTETDLGRSRCAGRVEHVVSGQATHFSSLEELLAFMARVLASVRAPRAGDRGAGAKPAVSVHQATGKGVMFLEGRGVR